MSDTNTIVITGRLTRDVDLRYTPNDNPVGEFGIASNRNYQDGSGEWQEDTTFVDVTVWGEQAERIEERISKGEPVLIEGRLTLDQWETDAGENRSKLSITAQRIRPLSQYLSDEDGAAGDGDDDFLEGDDEAPEPEDVDEDDDIPF